MNNKKLIRKFDKQARIYENRRRSRTEGAWREKLLRGARGRVLEVAVGAGANFHFYPKGIELTAVDFSPGMLSKAALAADEYDLPISFIESDVESLTFPDNSFDTIVSTLSFCGYEDPGRILQAFHKWCKRDGQILLMEHGLGSNRLVANIQHAMNPLFKRIVGCRLNRDIVAMLNQSNLLIKKTERHLLGAIHLVWAAPNK